MTRGTRMNKILDLLKFNSFACMLAACVGGASDPVDPEVSYPYSEAHSNGEAQNTLGGVAIRSNGSNGKLEIVTLSGTMDHDTRATFVSDGTYDLLDSNGFDGAAKLTDGQSSLSLRPFAPNYTASRIFDQSYSANDVAFDSVGVLGVVTRPTDLPTNGSATYRGESEVLIVTESAGFSLKGQSTVVANFTEFGSVDVTMNSFAATNLMTGSTTSAPIDTITVSNMVISSNRISGGTIATLQDDTSVSLTGSNTTTASEGIFFGFDPAHSGPDEVGGMILVQGDDGIVIGNFTAD